MGPTAAYPPVELIEVILDAHRVVLGKDFQAYRNHVYRVYYLSLFFAEAESDLSLAAAAAFHDLGIWVDKTWDYLGPSRQAADNWMKKTGMEAWTNIVHVIIEYHHKRTPYSGEQEHLVEAFRKADWVDVMKGLRYGKAVKEIYRDLVIHYPYQGFHNRLVIFFFRNLFRNPLKPMPMMR